MKRQDFSQRLSLLAWNSCSLLSESWISLLRLVNDNFGGQTVTWKGKCTFDFCGRKLEDTTGWTQHFTRQKMSVFLHARHIRQLCRACKISAYVCLAKCWVHPAASTNFLPRKSKVQPSFSFNTYTQIWTEMWEEKQKVNLILKTKHRYY